MAYIDIKVDTSILLRQFREEDSQTIFNLINNNRKHLSQFGEETSAKYPTLESVRNSIRTLGNPLRYRFGIWYMNTYVGTINLTIQNDDKNVAEIGYYIGKEYEGKGYVSKSIKKLVEEAFTRFHCKKVFAKVNSNNHKSINTLQKNGFRLDYNNSKEKNLYFYVEKNN